MLQFDTLRLTRNGTRRFGAEILPRKQRSSSGCFTPVSGRPDCVFMGLRGPSGFLSSITLTRVTAGRCWSYGVCNGQHSVVERTRPASGAQSRSKQAGLPGFSSSCLMRACYINECVRRWLWGIHLLQRLRVPPGFPSFPRMPVVMLLQLGAPTLCLRKRTPQSHLLCVGFRTYYLVSYRLAHLDFVRHV